MSNDVRPVQEVNKGGRHDGNADTSLLRGVGNFIVWMSNEHLESRRLRRRERQARRISFSRPADSMYLRQNADPRSKADGTRKRINR
jgi:hypothetical protein